MSEVPGLGITTTGKDEHHADPATSRPITSDCLPSGSVLCPLIFSRGRRSFCVYGTFTRISPRHTLFVSPVSMAHAARSQGPHEGRRGERW
uniref:Uncharacterized protein n=1 Tax=Knipowitschia caucasica TaxID=637954 RepID=A0AAV2JY40_KNICA